MEKITRKTTLEKILEIKGASDILLKYGVPCLSCPMAAFEIKTLKIGEISDLYNLDLTLILKELNKKRP